MDRVWFVLFTVFVLSCLVVIWIVARQMKAMSQEVKHLRKLHYDALNHPRSEDKLKD